MCQKCNEALQAGAHSAQMLANAAKTLYDMNDHVNSQVLADAAADLFRPLAKTNDEQKPFGEGETAGPIKGNPENKPDDVKLPPGFFIDDDGIVFVSGVAIGRIAVLGKPTKH